MTTMTTVVLLWIHIFTTLVAPLAAWSQDSLNPWQRARISPQFSSSSRHVYPTNTNIPTFWDESGNTMPSRPPITTTTSSRRNLFRYTAAALSAPVILWGYGDAASAAASGYKIAKAEPDEKDIYRMAQNQPIRGRPLKVLWIGSGAFAMKTGGAARSGVYKDLFRSGTEVTAVDLLTPTAEDLKDAQTYATERGGYTLKFQQGDATKLDFGDESFDAVVCSLFLCQDFDPVVVVREIQRVLKPGGRFGFYEHIEDIDKVVVGKVFGDRSVLKVEADPYLCNILAGVVKKV